MELAVSLGFGEELPLNFVGFKMSITLKDVHLCGLGESSRILSSVL